MRYAGSRSDDADYRPAIWQNARLLQVKRLSGADDSAINIVLNVIPDWARMIKHRAVVFHWEN